MPAAHQFVEVLLQGAGYGTSFAIADLQNQVVEFWRVPYDVEGVQDRMRAARLPEPLALRLSVGR